MERKTIYFSKWRMALMLISALIYMGVGIFLLFTPITVLIGVFFILNFLWIGRLAFLRLIGKIPAIVIDEDGLEDNSAWVSIGRVKWEAVDVIQTKRFFFHKYIVVRLKKPSEAVARLSNPIKRIGLSFKMLFHRTPIVFQTQMLGISYNELAQMLQDIDFDNPGFKDLSKHLID